MILVADAVKGLALFVYGSRFGALPFVLEANALLFGTLFFLSFFFFCFPLHPPHQQHSPFHFSLSHTDIMEEYVAGLEQTLRHVINFDTNDQIKEVCYLIHIRGMNATPPSRHAEKVTGDTYILGVVDQPC